MVWYGMVWLCQFFPLTRDDGACPRRDFQSVNSALPISNHHLNNPYCGNYPYTEGALLTMKTRSVRVDANRKRKLDSSISPPNLQNDDSPRPQMPQQSNFIPPSVALSYLDRAPQLELSHDQLTVSNTGVS